jgi:hypothetical protein
MLQELPVEVLARVLCALPCDEHARVAAVCRRLRALVGGGATWERVELLPPAAPPCDAWRALLRRAGTNLRRLDLSGVCDSGASVVAAVQDTLTGAQRAALTHLRCTGLAPAGALSAAEVSALLVACPALRRLRVDAACSVATDDALTALLRSPGRPAALRLARLYVHDAPETERCVWGGECTEQLRLLCGSCDEFAPALIETNSDTDALHVALPPTDGAGARLSLVSGSWGIEGWPVAQLARHPRLVGLRVHELAGANQLSALSDALAARARPLRALSVQDSVLGTQGSVERLAAALRASGSCLRRFELQNCGFFADEYDDERSDGTGRRWRARSACTLLANALADCACLEELSLAGSSFEEPDAAALALLLRASPSLRSFDVSLCALRSTGVAALAHALASPAASLTRLCVGSVAARAEGAHALARMLSVNTRLRELHTGGVDASFSSNAWRASDGEILLAALPHASPALRLLTLPLMLVEDIDDDDSDEDIIDGVVVEGELGHAAQLRQLTIKALRREHPQCAEVLLTDAFREFLI